MTIDRMTFGLPLLALTLLAPGSFAQAPAKVGIINIQGAILATKDGEKARDSIRNKFEARLKDIDNRNGEINKLREQYNKGANTMSAEAREKLSREIDDKQKRLQWDSEDLQNEIQQEEQKLVNEIGQRMIQIIDEHAKANNYTLILDVSGQTSPVLWAANGIDITTQIVELYDKKFGGGASGAPASGGPASGAPSSSSPPLKPTAPPVPAAKKPGVIK